MGEEVVPHTRRVYISYASRDRLAAVKIAEALEAQGLDVWYDSWALRPGDSIAARIREAVTSRDVLVVLISHHSANSQWMQEELSTFLPRQLQDRAIRVVPALLEDCDVPPALASWPSVDLTTDFDGAVSGLGQRLRVLPRIQFRHLDPPQFESLVADLLRALGFSINPTTSAIDTPVDMIGYLKTRDVFGAEQLETWFIQVKHYREQRISVSVLQQMLGYMLTTSRPVRGLIVTSAQLTSVAREFLTSATTRTGHQLRVVDSNELTSLLVNHPGIVEKHFGKEQIQ